MDRRQMSTYEVDERLPGNLKYEAGVVPKTFLNIAMKALGVL